MAFTFREDKGSDLTPTEVDENFREVALIKTFATSEANRAEQAANAAAVSEGNAATSEINAGSSATAAANAADRAEAIADFDGLHNTLVGRNEPNAHDASAIGFKDSNVEESLETLENFNADLANPGNGYRLIANQMAPNAYGTPGKLTNVREYEGPWPIDFFDGYFWGRTLGQGVFRSTDGNTWERYCDDVSNTTRLIPTGDGEVLLLTPDQVRKSAGWSTGNPVWSTVLTNPMVSTTPFLRWGFDGEGSKFIITHYGAGSSGSPAWENSRYVWISTDAGETWDVVWDTQSEFPGTVSHIHAACYDPWDGRFWFTEGHGTAVGIRYSDDNGQSWTRMENDLGMSPTFTTMTATDFGIVCGTDGPPNGIFLIRRQADPDVTGVEFMGRLGVDLTSRDGVIAFADRGMRDPDTGIVYVGFNSNFADVPSVVFACGAEGATIAYKYPGVGSAMRRFENVVAAKGKILMLSSDGSAEPSKLYVGDTSKFGARPTVCDRGNILADEGSFAGGTSIRAGRGSRAGGVRSVALGVGADAGEDSQDQIAIGYGATARFNGAVSIGFQSLAESGQAVAVGKNASATTQNAVAIGRDAESNGDASVAIGPQAKADTGGYAVSLGRQAESRGYQALALGPSALAASAWSTAIGGTANAASSYSISVGYQSVATGQGAMAIGREAKANHGDTIAIGRNASTRTGAAGQVAIGLDAKSEHGLSVALGSGAETQRDSSVCVGNRDIESTRAGGRIYLKSPDGTTYTISVSNAGELVATAG